MLKEPHTTGALGFMVVEYEVGDDGPVYNCQAKRSMRTTDLLEATHFNPDDDTFAFVERLRAQHYPNARLVAVHGEFTVSEVTRD